MAEGGLTGFPGRRKKAEQLALGMDDPKVEVHKLVAAKHLLVLDEMRCNSWAPMTHRQIAKHLGWALDTAKYQLTSNTALFELHPVDGWVATQVGRDTYATWKTQVYNARGRES